MIFPVPFISLRICGTFHLGNYPLWRCSLNNKRSDVERITKARRDAMRLKERARYILVLNDKAQAIDFIHNQNFFANIIAVLAPATISGVYLPEVLVLEVGISRTRPYAATEKVTWSGKKKSTRRFTLRRKAREMSESEFITAWQFLEKFFCSATFQTRSNWKPETKKGWWINTESGSILCERGVYFSVSMEDTFLHQQVLAEDVRTRRRYLRISANNINHWLRRYKLLSYPDAKLKSLKGVIKAVDLWKNMSLEPRLAREVIRLMNHNARELFRDALRVFHLSDPTNDEEDMPILSVTHLKDSRIRIVRGSGEVHGKNCITFEHFFEEGYRARNNI